MKTRVLIVILIFLFLTILFVHKDGRIDNILLSIINPIKQTYISLSKEMGDKSQSYVHQKENIQKLIKINRLLRERLLEQKHYLILVGNLYERIPSLEKLPLDSVDIVQTISYVKLNTFSKVILTKPRDFNGSKERLYGLIQGSVAAGVAHLENGNLYGALVSSDKCRFSVFIGKERAAGIAMGINTKQMFVKFIPKWTKIKEGDKVFTSGLDMIFFPNIPVGVVERVEIENSYKVAYIKPYADILHPDYFYLVKDPSVSLISKFDGIYLSDSKESASFGKKILTYVSEENRTILDSNLSENDINQTLDNLQDPHISSIPSVLPEEPKKIIQTRDAEVSEEQMRPPAESHSHVSKKKKRKKRKKRIVPSVRDLDAF